MISFVISEFFFYFFFYIWRFGSLIIDYEIIGSFNKLVNFIIEFVKCMIDFFYGKIKLMVLYYILIILYMIIKD